VQGHQTGFRSCTDQRQQKNQTRDHTRWLMLANCLKAVLALRTREQAEGKKERKCSKARHQDINEASMDIFWLAVMRQHQRPRRQ
jgi:hypothetical protein